MKGATMGRWILAVLLAASPVFAVTKGCPTGSFTVQTATGANADFLQVSGKSFALVVQTTMTAGTGATVILETSCNNGASWAKVANSDMALTSTTPTLAISMLYPMCRYRTNVTVCTGCTVQAVYACS
jgi:hypothetical protein